MWIVRLALAARTRSSCWRSSILLMAPIVIQRTPTDIFPYINIPVVSTIWNYTGLSAPEMANRIVSGYERAVTTTVNDIEHIESQTLDRHLGREDLLPAEGAASTPPSPRSRPSRRRCCGRCRRARRRRSSSPTAPRRCRCSSWRSRGQGLSEQQLFDLGNNSVRTQLATVEGAAIPFPYGGKQRQIQVDIDLARAAGQGARAERRRQRRQRAEPDPARRAPPRSAASSTRSRPTAARRRSRG